MSYELVRERIVLDEKIAKETTQVLLEGDLIVPDVKPDVSVVLQAEAKASIDRVDAGSNRVNFAGKLSVQVLYLARGSEKPVHSLTLVTPIDDFLNIEGVGKDTWVEVTTHITNLDYKMINDRKINYRAVVDVCAQCECTNEHDIITHINNVPENQLLKSNLLINRRVDNKVERFVVKDEMPLPSGKPNIREILQCSISVANKEVRMHNGRVAVNGELLVSTLYRGDNDTSIIEFVEHEMPFNGSLELSGAKEDMMADVTLSVIEQYVQPIQDNDGEERVLEVEVSMSAMVKVHCQESMEILEDAHCINKNLVINKTPMQYPKLICRNKNQSPIKEVVQLTDECPDILQIFRVKGRAIVDDVSIIDDKVVVEGAIEASVLYVAENDQMPLYSHNTMVPYRQTIETKGALPGMMPELSASVDHVAFNMLSGREMELRFLLSFNTQVFNVMEMNMVTDISFEDMDKAVLDSMASMTIYVVQKEDTLWHIAKKYNTSVDELMSVNDIEDPQRVPAGQRLLILKKVC